MKRSLEIIPFFLITIPLFLVLHIENEYRNIIIYRFVRSEIIELFAASFIIAGVFFLLVRNFRKAWALSIPVILIFYFFCEIKDILHGWNDQIFLSGYTFLIPAILTLLFFILRYLWKSRSDFSRLILYVNISFLLFILVEIVTMAVTPFRNNPTSHAGNPITHKNYIPCDTCVHPDIYYIVFDGYTSSKVLTSQFNYGNLRLQSFLQKKNFFLIDNSRSNYNLTPFSIGSTLNLDYLHALNVNKAFYLHEYLSGVSIVHENALIPILKKEGYEIFNHSIFEIDNFPSTITAFDQWEIYLLYSRHNILKKINKDIGWLIRSYLRLPKKRDDDNLRYEIHRDRHVAQTVAELLRTIKSKTKSPKFIYGHILLPHDPYTYDSTGNKLRFPKEKERFEEEKNAYVSQLAYTNTILETLVKSIFLQDGKPFIIILQGDHGFRYKNETKRSLEFANLNALYFYNQDYRLLHDSLSNVNTFRIVFKTFFQKNYALLKDSSYFLQYK